MRSAVRWLVGVVVVLHGLIHGLGFVKAFGWAEVTQLRHPISTVMGLVWLTAAVLVILAGVMLAGSLRGWWAVSAVAAAWSQAVIVTSWTDGWAGSAVNVLLLVAAGYGFAANGPRSLRVEYRGRVRSALGEQPLRADAVTESDLAALPPAVAAYVRRSGAVGEPGVANFRARIHGRIRAGTTKPWMSFTGEQVNTYGESPRRLFLMEATLFGLPVDVLHVFVGPSATMRVRLCSMLPMVNAAGPDMDRAETVTLFNDMCVLAPAALIDAPISWRSLDTHHVLAAFTNGVHTIHAELTFNDEHELVNFVSEDRTRASADGRHFTPQPWSTPIARYGNVGGRRIATYGEGCWHAPDPEGTFTYLDFHVDNITYNTAPDAMPTLNIGPRADRELRHSPIGGP